MSASFTHLQDPRSSSTFYFFSSSIPSYTYSHYSHRPLHP